MALARQAAANVGFLVACLCLMPWAIILPWLYSRPSRVGVFRRALLIGALAVVLAAPRAGFAEEPLTAKAPAKTLSWETGEGHSYYIPAFEIAGFIAGLSLFNRFFGDTDDYDSDLHSIKNNLTTAEVIDKDPFSINQIGHPYQGSIYYGFARSSGLNYWRLPEATKRLTYCRAERGIGHLSAPS